MSATYARRVSGPGPRHAKPHAPARCRRGSISGRWHHPCGVQTQLSEDRLGEAEPGRLARGRAVINPERRRSPTGRTIAPARSTVQVGCPGWSSTTVTVSRSGSRRAMVLTKFVPWAPYSQAVRTIQDAGQGDFTAHSPAALVRPYAEQGAMGDGRWAHPRRTERRHPRRRRSRWRPAPSEPWRPHRPWPGFAAPTALTAHASASWASAASTAVQAAASTTRSWPATASRQAQVR